MSNQKRKKYTNTDRKNHKKAKTKNGLKNHVGSRGYVYILSNPSFSKKYLKIGMTKRNVAERAKELSGATGVPTEFEIKYFTETSDCEKLESIVHKDLEKYRVKQRREFFDLPLSKAIKSIESNKKSIDKKSDKRIPLSPFLWSALIIFTFFVLDYMGIDIIEYAKSFLGKISSLI